MKIFLLNILLLIFFMSHSSYCQTFDRYFISDADSEYFSLGDIQPTSDGGFISTGFFSDSLITGATFLLKLDSAGMVQWTRGYDYHHCSSTGYKVIQTHDHGYMLVADGYFNGPEDIFLIRTDSLGDTLWTKMLGGFSGDYPADVIQTADHGFVIAATTESFGSGHTDLMLFKVTSTGNAIWSKCFGTLDTLWANPNYEESIAVFETSSGGYLLAGYVYYEQKALLIETDSIGNMVWCKSFDADMKLQSVSGTADGYLITSGSIMTKTDLLGNIQWSRSYYGWPQDVFQFLNGDLIWIDENGIVKSDSVGNILFSQKHILYGNIYIFFTLIRPLPNNKLLFGGEFSFMGSTDNSKMFSIFKSDSIVNSSCFVDDSTLVSPEFFFQATIPALMFSDTLIQTQNTDLTILYPQFQVNDCSWINVESINVEDFSFKLYPNPATNQFAVSIPIANEIQFPDGQMEIYNSLGEKIYSAAYREQSTVNCGHFPKGLYFVRISNSEKQFVQKLIIE